MNRIGRRLEIREREDDEKKERLEDIFKSPEYLEALKKFEELMGDSVIDNHKEGIN